MEQKSIKDQSGCEYIKCPYAARDNDGKPICQDSNEYVNEYGEAVCGRREDAIPKEEWDAR